MKKIEIRENGTKRVYEDFSGYIDKTDQSFKAECDVNNIINRYMKTGEINHRARTAGIYGDFSNITDLKESMELVKYANEQFMEIPAEIRKKFGNDPTQLTEWLQDPKNLDDAIKHGLLERRPNDDEPKTTTNPPTNSQEPETPLKTT